MKSSLLDQMIEGVVDWKNRQEDIGRADGPERLLAAAFSMEKAMAHPRPVWPHQSFFACRQNASKRRIDPTFIPCATIVESLAGSDDDVTMDQF
ncbi:hypothetical protein [Brevibacillus sp. CF112]|uniref:hypothetical protein n=1 Tax=Brevibacillus TaxID=55080 RepID=UPI0012F62327|nr:hypothetical protein [Brevibacillus sp. CF112]